MIVFFGSLKYRRLGKCIVIVKALDEENDCTLQSTKHCLKLHSREVFLDTCCKLPAKSEHGGQEVKLSATS